MKPFIKWVGGKTQLLPEINNLLQVQNFDTYIEPFVGGGSVFFNILENYTTTKQVINDINSDLINVYTQIKNNPGKLNALLLKFQLKFDNYDTQEERKEFYLTVRDGFNNDEIEPLKRAAYFIYLNKTGFNGLYRVNKSGKFNTPSGKYKTAKIYNPDLVDISEAIKDTIILNGDFASTLDYIQGNTLFYFDPPYKPISDSSSFAAYDKSGFNDNEQIRLFEMCKKIDQSGNKFILSNSYHDFFFELYKEFKIKVVEARRSINSKGDSRGKISEIIIHNL